MAAVATKKPGGDMGVQLGFPYVFQKHFDAGFQYFPESVGPSIDLFTGNTFQSDYHQLKRLEADQSVMNGIQNRYLAEQKLLTGIHNFHLPKPVLGQRRYANPSYGAMGGGDSARRDNGSSAPWRTVEEGMNGGMHGGVLRTAEGWDYYASKREDRIRQLNNINALAQGVPVPMGQEITISNSELVGGPNKVEFFILLNALMDSVTEGDLNRITFDNVKDLVGKLLQFGPTAEMEDFNDILHALDTILRDLRQGTEADAAPTLRFKMPDAAMTLLILIEKMRQYTTQMFASMNLSEFERKSLSKSLVKTLGLDRLTRVNNETEVVEVVRQEDRRVDQAAEDVDDGDDDGRFEAAPEGREDGEQGNAPRAPFAGENDDPNRARWGQMRGAWNAPPAYFGEEVAEEMAAPLGLAGADAERVPAQDIGLITQTLDAVINDILAGAGGGGGGTREDKMNMLYPQPENFVQEVVAGMEGRGFTPEQIAAGMDNMADFQEVFAEYIGENTGALGPGAAALPAAPLALPGAFPGAFPGGANMFAPFPLAPGLPPAAAPAALPRIGQQPAAPGGGWNYPATRRELREQIRTIQQARAFGETVPANLGGPYVPRASSKLKNVITRIIQFIQKVDPNY